MEHMVTQCSNEFLHSQKRNVKGLSTLKVPKALPPASQLTRGIAIHSAAQPSDPKVSLFTMRTHPQILSAEMGFVSLQVAGYRDLECSPTLRSQSPCITIPLTVHPQRCPAMHSRLGAYLGSTPESFMGLELTSRRQGCGRQTVRLTAA